ncbi:tectonic-like complex member Mks1 [Culex pipiens pallens]|uniref:tectonic-like complex member Mks1 n=1 Tax=Culex pipiens pallens TaxID=42434 RepID=UPI0019536A25|nr:tectonic-like complex member Mks1 [Culex pipiens pallens]
MFSTQKSFKTGVYRSNGAVANWKFRISLKKIHSLIEIPRFDQTLEPNILEEQTENEEVQLNISWQEKVFSQYEIDYYGVKNNCITDLQKNYHHIIKSTGLSEQRKNDKIFTYTTADNYSPDEEIFDMAKQATRQRIDQDENAFESMYIMADLDSEVLLFSLRWDPTEKLLLIYPDFNCMKINPYYKEIQGDSRQMYHFGIKNLSRKGQFTGSKETVQIQDNLINKLMRLTLREELSKDHFSYPNNHQQQFLVLLEIKSGVGFSYDYTHVRFKIDLPIEAKITDGFIDGSTHSSKQTKGTWQYAHCHEICFEIPENHDIDENVRVYFEVISIDSWKRERLLGNACLDIKLMSQVVETTLTCLKIANNNNFYDKLEAFLVGGRREINLEEFFGSKENSLLNRYGSSTERSGELDIKCQVVQQHRPQIIQLAGGPNAKKHGKFRANVITIEELLSSYQRARERLEDIVNLKY